MGADLLIRAIALPFDVEPDWHAARKHIWACDNVESLDPDQYFDEGASLDDVQKELIDALNELIPVLDGSGWARDIDCLPFCGHWLWITGGMSWGDSPTDTYDFIRQAETCGALSAAGFDPPGLWAGPPEEA